MPKYTIHTIESAPEGSRDTMRAIHKKFGFLPNLIGELAAAPSAVKAYATLSQLVEQTSFTPVEQQLILLTVSSANGCDYCVAAHSAGLHAAELPRDQIDAARRTRPLADGKLEALRRFARAVVETRGHVDEAGLRAFLDAGYTKEQVFELLVGVAMKTLSNYTNHIAETPLDEQLEAFAWNETEAA